MLSQLILMDTMNGSAGLITMPWQKPKSHMQTLPWVLHRRVFSFRVDPPADSHVICWCLLWCLLSAFRFSCGCHVHQLGAQPLGFATLQLFGSHPWQVYVPPVDVSMAHNMSAPRGCSTHSLSRRELHATHSPVPQAIPSMWWGIQL